MIQVDEAQLTADRNAAMRWRNERRLKNEAVESYNDRNLYGL